jgi:hypothetical protein
MKKFDTAEKLSGIALEHFETGKSFSGWLSASDFKTKYSELYPSRKLGSILPSDYAHNNEQVTKEKYRHFLEKDGRDNYRFVGLRD